jgi:hypothetical protein
MADGSRYIASARAVQKAFSIIAWSFVAGETCPQSCFPAAAVYTAITWQWVYMSQYVVFQT